MVRFFFQQPVASLKDRRALKLFLSSIFKKKGKAFNSLSCIFCSDDELLEINKQFLQHDHYTDIISFNLAGKNDPIEADIYISVDRVRDNAQQQGTYFKEELHRVIFHGVLHLCGYKDKTKADIRSMRAAEDSCLKAYFDVPRIPVSIRNKDK